MPLVILKDAAGHPTHVILTIEEYRDLQQALASHPAVSEGLKRLKVAEAVGCPISDLVRKPA